MPTEKQIASTFIRVGKRREFDDKPAAVEDRTRRPPGLIDTSHRRPGQITHNFEPQRVGLIVDVVFERSSRTVFVPSFGGQILWSSRELHFQIRRFLFRSASRSPRRVRIDA